MQNFRQQVEKYADREEGFADPRRNIDVDEEGYSPIKEAVKWFKDIQIPLSLADEVTELVWDGGLHVFHQIISFWDGEDDYFDIKKISKQKRFQFKNLKSVTAGEGFSKEAIKVLSG